MDAPLKLQEGDILLMRKAHPCGAKEWELLRVGQDLKLKCTGCGHLVMVPRRKIERSIVSVKTADAAEA
ncbi:MAG: DUF951 domain-containing protein [Lachnospiraceae bacterium]|nr:DUF951 domain-containing protein [Lachnospiraceae bacterium]